MFLSECHKFVQTLLPKGRVRFPNKAQLLEESLALIRHGRVLSFFLNLVLVPLAFNPLSQRRILGPVAWNAAVVILLSELTKLEESFVPSTRLVRTDTDTCRRRKRGTYYVAGDL